MNAAKLRQELDQLSLEERLELVQELWDGIAADPAAFEVSEGHLRVLERRLADLDANPHDTLSWEEVRDRLRKRLG